MVDGQTKRRVRIPVGYLTFAQAADVIGCSPGRFSKMTRERSIPVYNLPSDKRCKLIKGDELRAFIAAHHSPDKKVIMERFAMTQA